MNQENQRNIQSPSEYFLADSKSDSIQINLWGEVNNPGVYHLSKKVDLITLLSLAHGPTQNANLKNIKIVNDKKNTVKTIDISAFVKKGEDLEIPHVSNGSTVIVSRKLSSKVYRYLSWVSRILGIFSIYFMIRYYYISG